MPDIQRVPFRGGDDVASSGAVVSLPRPTAVTPQAPTRPVEAPVETPSRPADRPDPDSGSDADSDLDDELERIIREIPDPTPQPGGE